MAINPKEIQKSIFLQFEKPSKILLFWLAHLKTVQKHAFGVLVQDQPILG